MEQFKVTQNLPKMRGEKMSSQKFSKNIFTFNRWPHPGTEVHS